MNKIALCALALLLIIPTLAAADSFEVLTSAQGVGPLSAPLMIDPGTACAFDAGKSTLICIQAGSTSGPQSIAAKAELDPQQVCPILALHDGTVLVAGAAQKDGRLLVLSFDLQAGSSTVWDSGLSAGPGIVAAPELINGVWLLQDAQRLIALRPGEKQVVFQQPGWGLPRRVDALVGTDAWRNAIQGELIWIASPDQLVARRIADGEQMRSAKLDAPAVAAPVFHEQIVFVPGERELTAFNAADASKRGSLPGGMLPGSEPILVFPEGRAFYASTRGLLCFRPQSLRVRYNYPVPGEYVLLDGDESWRFVHHYTKATDGRPRASIYRQKVKSAQLHGGVEFEPPGSALHVQIGERLVIEMASGKLYSLEAVDLVPQAEYAVGEQPLSGIAAIGTTIAVSDQNKLVLLKLVR
ncbi:MAG: hypothetical protein P9M14_10190 [Candidatus Alcyoniella australis]|nr:hypothetical protein [Candidatus Alcyoniella australis]